MFWLPIKRMYLRAFFFFLATLISLNCWLSFRKDKTKSLCGKTNHLFCTFSLPAHLLACFSDLGMFKRQLLHHAKASASNISDSYAQGSGTNSSASKLYSVMVLQFRLFKMCRKAAPFHKFMWDSKSDFTFWTYFTLSTVTWLVTLSVTSMSIKLHING